VPLVAKNLRELIDQAHIARHAGADLVEWRADSYSDVTAQSLIEAARDVRLILDREPILYSLRIAAEGGARQISQEIRKECMDAVVRSRLIDLVDAELCNGPEMIGSLIQTAHGHSTHVILSFHDFEGTPANATLLGNISDMIALGADVAKIACMPREPGDVLRLLQTTLSARQTFPAVPLCMIAMGSLGSLSRVAGFLFGSDMTFAVGQQSSAPGQIPIAEARNLTETLLRYSGEFW
jgi:3-dehydroquinate dehydratase-1